MTQTFKVTSSISFPTAKQIKASGTNAKSTGRAMNAGVLRASRTTEMELPMYLSRAMEMNVWGPFQPKFPYYRKNGEFAGSGTRDLIDMGRLHDSLSIKTQFLQTKVNTRIMYTAPYAKITYWGGVIQPYGNPNAAAVVLPARPWIEATLLGTHGVERYNVVEVYQREISKAWSEI